MKPEELQKAGIDHSLLFKLSKGNESLETIWTEIAIKVRNMRNIISNPTKKNKFRFGEIIIDSRDYEMGFVVGPFEAKQYTHHPQGSLEITPSGPDTTYLIVTSCFNIKELLDFASKDDSFLEFFGDEIEKGYGIASEPNFRVRYVKERNLKKVDLLLDDNLSSEESTTDLADFCTYQCILPCSEECVLRRYKCYPPDKE